jgi:hypothetical protein
MRNVRAADTKGERERERERERGAEIMMRTHCGDDCGSGCKTRNDLDQPNRSNEGEGKDAKRATED